MRILAIAFTLLLVACASTPEVIRKSSAQQTPAWRDKTPTNPQYLFFVGAKSGASSLEEGKAAATSAAIGAVAQYIGVSVSALVDVVDSTKASENKASQTTNLQTAGQIQGAEVADTYWEAMVRQLGATEVSRYDVWVLVKFPRAAAEAERARQDKVAQDNATNALDLYTKAQAARTAKNENEALRLLSLASKALASLGKPVDLQSAEFHTTNELTDAVKVAKDQVVADVRRSLVISNETVFGAASNETTAGDKVAATLASKGFPATVVSGNGFGMNSNAGRLVKVTAVVSRTGTLYGQAVCIATVKAQVVDAASQEVLAEADKEAKIVKPNPQQAAHEALAAAGGQAANELVKALTARESK